MAEKEVEEEVKDNGINIIQEHEHFSNQKKSVFAFDTFQKQSNIKCKN